MEDFSDVQLPPNAPVNWSFRLLLLFNQVILRLVKRIFKSLKGENMATTHSILADVSAGISELKKNPMAVVEQGDGAPVAILNRNRPVFYAVPAEAYELLMDKLEDIELAAIVKERQNMPEIEVSLDEL